MNDMMKQSFEDLGAVLEDEWKAMHRHKKEEGKEGKVGKKSERVAAGATLCRIL